jgi:hypothetical protein
MFYSKNDNTEKKGEFNKLGDVYYNKYFYYAVCHILRKSSMKNPFTFLSHN